MQPSYDISSDDVRLMEKFADEQGGQLAVTREGTLIIYGLTDAQSIVDAQPFAERYVTFVDDTTIAFEF